MPKVYIEKRADKFLAIMELPLSLRNSGVQGLPKRRFVASTETGDAKLAEQRARGLGAEWESMIDQARGSLNADFYRRKLEALGGAAIREIITVDLGDGRTAEIDNATAAPVAEPGVIPVPVRRLTKLARYVDDWQSGSDATQKTKDGQRATVAELSRTLPNVEDIDSDKVRAWALSLLEGDAGISKATLRRKLFFLGAFWRHLQTTRKGLAPGNPFDPRAIIGKAKNHGRGIKADHRQAFAPGDIVKLARAARRDGDGELADFIDCARWTGARREELAQLRVENVKLAGKLPHLEIVEGKSKAALRTIPIHAALAPVLKRLCARRPDGFVFAYLEEGKYGIRSNQIGNRFSALKTAEGYGPQFVLHSIRKTVAGIFKDAGVAEFVAADILGHEISTMSYGVYAGAVDLATKAAAIAKLRYPGST